MKPGHRASSQAAPLVVPHEGAVETIGLSREKVQEVLKRRVGRVFKGKAADSNHLESRLLEKHSQRGKVEENQVMGKIEGQAPASQEDKAGAVAIGDFDDQEPSAR